MTIEVLLAIAGPASGAVWWLVTIASEKRTRNTIREEFSQIIDAKLDAKLVAFKKELNSEAGYRRSESCTLMMNAVAQRLDAAEEDIHEIQKQQVRALAPKGNC